MDLSVYQFIFKLQKRFLHVYNCT